MAGTDNLETVQRAFKALGTNDLDTFKRLLADDVVWRSPGPADVLPFAGVHRGPEEVADWWRKLGESEETLHFAPKTFVAHDNEVIVVGDSEMRVRATGKQMRDEWVHIYTVKDGKIVAFREFYDTAQEVRGYDA